MSLTTVLSLLAGIGLFLYGMDLMGAGLKNAAGASLEKILEKLTNSRLKGLLLGTGVTAIIQSSAATSIMVLGFVNAGVMTLAQAIPVVFGANIGSTITGQILRLGDISNDNFILTMLKPSSLAPLLMAFGVVILVFMKNSKKRLQDLATVLLGLGVLFIGMSTMESSISPLKDEEWFQNLFTLFTNPFLGVLVGAVITAVIQSSSASVGILQALSSTGAITWNVAIPIILGQNIGKCFTVFLGSLSTTSKDSKRVALCHFLFNVFGAILIGGAIYLYQYLVGIPFWTETLNRGNIADFHSLFNIITAFVLLPFSGSMASLSQRIIKDGPNTDTKRHWLDQLDDLLLKTPAVALEAAMKVVIKMGETAVENFEMVSNMIENGDKPIDQEQADLLLSNENFLDRAESKVSDYLVKINSSALTMYGNLETNEILRTVADFERIGDYCINIYETVKFDEENNVTISNACRAEMMQMDKAIRSILEITLDAFRNQDTLTASRVEPLEQVIDGLKEFISARHIERLKTNNCTVQAGISLTEYLNSVERISDHCSNIAIHTIRAKLTNESDFDTHSYLSNMHQANTEEYQSLFRYYEQEFFEPMTALPLYDAPQVTAAQETPEDTSKSKKDKDAKGKKKSQDKEKEKDKSRKASDKADKAEKAEKTDAEEKSKDKAKKADADSEAMSDTKEKEKSKSKVKEKIKEKAKSKSK